MEESQDKTNLLDVKKDILWGMYQELRTHARHNETLRSTVTNIIIVASAGLVTLSTYDQKVDKEDIPATSLLIVFGFFGILFNLAYTERYDRHNKRSREYQEELDELFFNGCKNSVKPGTLKELKERGNNSSRYRDIASVIRRISNNHILWVALPAVVSIIGVLLTIKALQTPVCLPPAPR